MTNEYVHIQRSQWSYALRKPEKGVAWGIQRPESSNVVVRCRSRMPARITSEGRYLEAALRYLTARVEEAEKYGSQNNGEERRYLQMLGWRCRTVQ
jgi:hypothetical protein